MDKSNLDSVLERVRELFEQAYERGAQEALRRVADVIRGPGGASTGSRGGRRGRPAGRPASRKGGGRTRARRGAARAFIERVLKEKGNATVPQIMAAASNADEKAVSISAIRFELYRGKKDRRYKNTSGKWSLPGRAAKE